MFCILIKGKYKHINFTSKLLNYSHDKIWLKTLFYNNVFNRASPSAKCYTFLFLQLNCPICKVTPTYFSFVSNTNFLVSSKTTTTTSAGRCFKSQTKTVLNLPNCQTFSALCICIQHILHWGGRSSVSLRSSSLCRMQVQVLGVRQGIFFSLH